jgi:uncharacterized membrane protein
MTDAAVSTETREPLWARRSFRVISSIILTGTILGASFGPKGLARVAALAGKGRLHWPDFDLVAAEPLAVKIHLATILGAVLVGLVQVSGVKGSRLHKTLGWAWVAFMGSTAVASLFIHQSRPGGWSFLHVFAVIALASLVLGVWAIRRGNVVGHRSAMMGLFIGGLLVAGVTAFMPGRLMWRVFFA